MQRALGISTTMLGTPIDANDLARAGDLGITHLEVFVAPDGSGQDASDFEMIGEDALSVWSVHAPFGGDVDLSAPDECTRRRSVRQVLDACKVASDLEANYVVVHAGLSTGDEEEQSLRRTQSMRSLNELLERTCALPVRLAIEYLPANKPRLCNDSAEICEVLSLCDGSPGVCLDTNHANLRADLVDETRNLAEHICTLHLSDNHGQEEMHLMPGEGVIDWESFIGVLDEIDYTGPLMYEALGGESVSERLEMAVTSAAEIFGWEQPDG